ncbi:hypothetical protein ACLKA7_004646 [Drosophila subpalustris]
MAKNKNKNKMPSKSRYQHQQRSDCGLRVGGGGDRLAGEWQCQADSQLGPADNRLGAPLLTLKLSYAVNS